MTAGSGQAPRRAIVDPTLAQIAGVDGHLPAVPPARLQPQAIRRRFEVPPAWEPEVSDDRFRLSGDEPRPAAVLVPLVTHAHGVSVLLTQRTAHLSSHAGQIAFPGGRTEPTDPTPVATALRESQEEIGLDHAMVHVLGALPPYRTGTGFVVTPVVGLVEPHHTLQTDPNEVAEAFEVPLSFLMDPANHQRRLYRWGNAERMFFAMPWRAPGAATEYFIWGATAAMLRNLYRFLSA